MPRRLEQVECIFFKLVDHLPQGRDAGTGGKQGLAHLALLGENLFSPPQQGIVIDAVERFEDVRFQTEEKWGQDAGFHRVARLIKDIANPFFAALKTNRFAGTVFEAPADQQLIVAVKKIIGRLLGEPVQQGLERPKGAALSRLVGAKNNVQARFFGIKHNGPAGKGAEGRQVQSLQPHPAPPCSSSLAIRSSCTSDRNSAIFSAEGSRKGSSPPWSSAGSLLFRADNSGTSDRRASPSMSRR